MMDGRSKTFISKEAPRVPAGGIIG
ncbi:MAG: hypothetical protein JWN24_4679, partial [Phycisphaerales bacterium]|nr:hypothetical protein [Phycisphaerales bacterium]